MEGDSFLFNLILFIQETEMDIRSFTERIFSKICCYNPFHLDADIPEDQSCYTCAFRVDRMDK